MLLTLPMLGFVTFWFTIPTAWAAKNVSKWLRGLGAIAVIVADKDGIALTNRDKDLWRVAWSEIESVQSDPRSQTTTLLTQSGARFDLPFAMGPDASFRPDRNSLYLLLRSKQSQESYARPTASPNFWKDYRDYPADHGGFWFFAWVTSVIILPFAALGGLQLSTIAPACVLNLVLGFFAAIPTGKPKSKDIDADWWERLGPADSLYRQLNQVAAPAYGTSRYGTEFREAEERTSELTYQFNVNWRKQAPVMFEKIREVYLSPEGISFTKGGPICQVTMEQVPDDLRAGKVHMYVTDDDGTAVFDPRYLRLVESDEHPTTTT